jgi:molybdate transport system regulatory protein
MDSLSPRAKLWIEHDGKLAMSDYRVRILEIIAETGSLAKAASEMKLSYRRAWGKVKEMEENLGYPLVRSEVGGAGGGHTALTPEGERLVGAYRRFHDRVGEAVDLAFREEFGGTTTG